MLATFGSNGSASVVGMGRVGRVVEVGGKRREAVVAPTSSAPSAPLTATGATEALATALCACG